MAPSWRKIIQTILNSRETESSLSLDIAADDDWVLQDFTQPGALDEWENALRQVNFTCLLQAFGAGLLGQAQTTYRKPVEERLLNLLGRRILQQIEQRRLDHQLQHEQQLKTAAVQNVRPLNKLKNLSPEEFEHWTKGYFERFGFRDVEVTQLSGDFGVDVYMKTVAGKQAVVQRKRYKGVVGRPTVQQTYGAMKLVNARHCYAVTTGRFTAEAQALDQRRDIHLLDGAFLTSERIPPGGRRKLK